jgi:hypothetical protein
MTYSEMHYVYNKGREKSKLIALNVRRLYPFILLVKVDWKHGGLLGDEDG